MRHLGSDSKSKIEAITTVANYCRHPSPEIAEFYLASSRDETTDGTVDISTEPIVNDEVQKILLAGCSIVTNNYQAESM